MPKPDNAKIYGRFPSGKARDWESQRHGSVERSKTFPGIARAMAEQWGDYILNGPEQLTIDTLQGMNQ